MSEYRCLLLHKLLVVGVNILIIVALFFSMYKASLFPEEFNSTFFITIFSSFVPIIVLGYLGRRYLLNRQKMLS